ncbi:mitochondrial inner membrane protein OXA1 [Podospora australis]|uniref:Mitochondrial inner membrane protein OXA1 n=1 Tax=Podospora australis TaxID=1536484 RepID=A0AAN6WS62_9PEZI|nr:mitochondrial inner membrane protein OXA1 [Podospora australis]
MLPSRGLLRSSSSLGLAKAALQKPSTRVSARQFGTALRNHGALSHNPSTFAGRRIASPIASTAASLAAFRQIRFASTEPLAAPAATTPVDGAATGVSSSLGDITNTPIDLTGSDLLNISEQIGFMKAYGLDFGFGPTSLMQWLLEHIYIYTGLPWWASIGLSALAIRAVLFKPSIDAADMQNKIQELKRNPEYDAAVKAVQETMFAQNANQADMLAARKKVSIMNKKAGYKMWKSLVPMIQIPLGIGMFRLLNASAALPIPSMEFGGALWFHDLTVADPFFILPILSGVFFISGMRIPLAYMSAEQSRMMKLISMVMAPLTIGVTMFMPAGLQLYFLISGGLHYLQTLLTYQNWFRRIFGLAPVYPGGAFVPVGYQAPRIMDVKAPRVQSSVVAHGPQQETMFQTIKAGKDLAMEKLNNYSNKGNVEKSQKSAKAYEEKRILEEKEKLIARREVRKMAKNLRAKQ